MFKDELKGIFHLHKNKYLFLGRYLFYKYFVPIGKVAVQILRLHKQSNINAANYLDLRDPGRHRNNY